MKVRPYSALFVSVLCGCAPATSPPRAPEEPALASNDSSPPVSAIEALTRVLSRVERPGVDGVEAFVERVEMRSLDEAPEIQLSLDLALLAEDQVEATRALGELTEALEALPWARSVAWGGTDSLVDPPGIRVRDMTVLARLDAGSGGVSAADAGYRIRSVASRDGIALGNLDVSRRVESPALEQYSFLPSPRAATFQLDRILRFLTELDDGRAGLVVTGVHAERAKSTQGGASGPLDAWTFSGRLTKHTGG